MQYYTILNKTVVASQTDFKIIYLAVLNLKYCCQKWNKTKSNSNTGF